MGSMDPVGDPMFYMFDWTLQQKVAQYKKEGKNPFDLLDPSKPDYMGNPEAIKPFQKTFDASLRSRTQITNPPVPPSYPGAPSVPVVVPRQSGESVEDYLKRTGGAP